MTTYIDEVRKALAFAVSAIRSGEQYSDQCQRVFESAKSAIQAHEEEDWEREAVLAELVGTLVGIRACAKIDGRPEWLTVAEQIDAALTKVKP